MNQRCFTLFEVSSIYPLFTEQNTHTMGKTIVWLWHQQKKHGPKIFNTAEEPEFSMVVSVGINRSHFAIMSC